MFKKNGIKMTKGFWFLMYDWHDMSVPTFVLYRIIYNMYIYNIYYIWHAVVADNKRWFFLWEKTYGNTLEGCILHRFVQDILRKFVGIREILQQFAMLCQFGDGFVEGPSQWPRLRHTPVAIPHNPACALDSFSVPVAVRWRIVLWTVFFFRKKMIITSAGVFSLL